MTRFGLHAGLQNTTVAELQGMWRRAEELGFDWVSVWDHFYTSDLSGYECHEAVAMHAALATTTTSVECGCLVYCAGYRHPGVLAKAVTTVDHLSGGRAAMGLGAGWAKPEYDAYGIDFARPGARLDLLAESAAVVRSLLRNESTTFEGQYFTLTDARLEPRPVQAELPLWIGGGGERRTLRIVAEHADGWNVPFVSPADLRHKRDVLDQHCADVGRDPAAIRTAVNVGLCADEDSLQRQFGLTAERVRPGVLMGTGQALVDRIGEYVEAGADQINVALRAPWDPGSLDLAAEAIAASR
jgi:F420-dependent oxidoreductase-like protein